ncbi:MAG: class I SAM-dependent methyltransferase [Ruminiclostridium sp.]|nr:class I SAM-dependent methyltransferase [Ruminiclostridium sp.]
MEHQSKINKKAWNYRAYEFWNKYNGAPEDVAKDMIINPELRLKRHIEYLGDVKGKRIANLLGSNGRKGVPLALLGADVTIVDISEENEKYATELAKSAGVSLRYIVSDLLDLNTYELQNYFDIVYLEGGILHYFSNLHTLSKIIYDILKIGGSLVLNDSHPVRKILKLNEDVLELSGDYFDDNLQCGNVAYKDHFPTEEQKDFPDCLLRFWTMGEIISNIASVGFVIERLVEEPRWDSFKHIPGNFTLIAKKYKIEK